MTSPDDSPTWFELRTSRPRPNVAVVAISGELDSTAAARTAALLQGPGVRDSTHLAIDLTEVTFMGSAGASVLLALRHSDRTTAPAAQVPAANVHLVGLDGNRAVRGVLHILGLDTVFSTFPDLDTCLRHLDRHP